MPREKVNLVNKMYNISPYLKHTHTHEPMYLCQLRREKQKAQTSM